MPEIVSRSGYVIMRSATLACVVRYAKYKADLVLFGVSRRVDYATGKPYYILGLRFADGATCNAFSYEWRGAIRLLARGVRRANGPFPPDLQPSPGCLPEATALFYELRDLPKGGERQGDQRGRGD